MVTLDSVLLEKEAETISKLLENSLKTNYDHYFCCTHFWRGNGWRQRLLFTCVYMLAKSNPADSVCGLAVSNLTERQRVEKQNNLQGQRGH